MWQPGVEGSLGENGYLYMYDWVSSVHLKLLKCCLLNGYNSIQNKRLKKSENIQTKLFKRKGRTEPVKLWLQLILDLSIFWEANHFSAAPLVWFVFLEHLIKSRRGHIHRNHLALTPEEGAYMLPVIIWVWCLRLGPGASHDLVLLSSASTLALSTALQSQDEGDRCSLATAALIQGHAGVIWGSRLRRAEWGSAEEAFWGISTLQSWELLFGERVRFILTSGDFSWLKYTWSSYS